MILQTDSTVFIVDDDQAVRDALVLLLETVNLSVEAFASGEAFIENYKEERPGCLALDISMPGMSGLELQEELAKKHIRIPVIFITGHGDVPMSVHALKAGAFDFIEKPFDNDLILSRIKDAIAWDLAIREEAVRKVSEAVSIYAESIVETVREPLLVLDENLNLISANRSFYKTFKISVPETERSVLEKFQETLWRIPNLKDSINKTILKKAELRDFEARLVSPDYGVMVLRFNARELQQHDRYSKRILLAIEDISKRKLAEEKFRALLESAPDAIVAVNDKGHITLINQQTENIFGYQRQELLGQKLEVLIPESMHKDHKQQRDMYFRDPSVRQMGVGRELRGLRKNRTEFPVAVSLSPFQSDEGLLVLASIKDITNRKQMEQALFEEKERAQVTLRSIGDAVITTNAKGIVEFLNPIAESLTGWSSDEAKDQALENIFNIIDERTRQAAPNPVARCLQRGEPVGLESNTSLISRAGSEISIENSAAPIQDKAGNILGAVMVFKNVTRQRQMAREIAHHATHDPLTGLVNRREFEKRLEHAVASSLEQGYRHVLCFLDLDQFKIVNDVAGHAAGDELLKQVAVLLQDKLRERDTLARLGGDEFGLIFANCPMENAFEIAETLIAEIRNYHFAWDRQTFQIGASVGLVAVAGELDNSSEVLRKADMACYTAKNNGRNQVHVYQAEEGESALRHREILHVADLSSALKQDRLRLYCQPIIELANNDGSVKHYEILLRMLDNKGDLVLPGTFIATAERSGIMVAIDRWVIETMFHYYMDVFSSTMDSEIAINLSGNSISDESLPKFIHEQFIKTNMHANKVCFEITESTAIHNFSQAKHFITEMKKLGCQFALDDFGSGLSSFTYLKKLPVNYIKIEGGIVSDMLENKVDSAIVAAINQIGHTLDVRIIAKHAETQLIIDRLKDLGVDFAQGYGICEPIPLEHALHRSSKKI